MSGTGDQEHMRIAEQLRYWGIGFAVFVVLLWLLADAVLPFILGAALAYLTDPLADRLERMGFSRLVSTILITIGSLAAGSVLMILLVPPLLQQIANALTAAPSYFESLRVFVHTHFPTVAEDNSALQSAVENLRSRADEWSVAVLKGLWTGGLAVVDFVSVAVITPVVAFYLLYDWDRMVTWIDDALPRQHQATIRKLMVQLDKTMAGFVRGQLSVCAILGSFYAIALSVLGLPFGLLIGAFSGLISFIPFVGSILGGITSIGLAVVHFWGEWGTIAAVAAVFATGQMVEGNFLSPKLVGDNVGLHPVWLLFALSAFGTLFGFVGLLIAVPAASAIGVFGRFFLDQYKEGRLYLGSDVGKDQPARRQQE